MKISKRIRLEVFDYQEAGLKRDQIAYLLKQHHNFTTRKIERILNQTMEERNELQF